MSKIVEKEIKAVGYIRISKDEVGKLSLESQKEVIETFCKNKGWNLIKFYEDRITGGTDKRVSYQQLLTDCRNKEIDVIVVYRLDRFSRSVINFLLTIEELKNLNVDFVSLSENFDSSTSLGKMVMTIIIAFAEMERSLAKDRTLLVINQKLQRGELVSRSCYGYRIKNKVYVPHPKESENVKLIYDFFEKGLKINMIAQNFKTYPKKIYEILSNPVYCGYLVYNKRIFKSEHEVIIDKDRFLKVQELLNRKRYKKRNIDLDNISN